MTQPDQGLKARLIRCISAIWCSYTHGGGHVNRDAVGRINWQCAKCGQWGDDPVSLKDENSVVDRDIAAAIRARANGGE